MAEVIEHGKMENFADLLSYGVKRGGFETDDVLASIIPLMEQVQVTHDEGKVAPLIGCEALRVTHKVLWYQTGDGLKPKNNKKGLGELAEVDKGAVIEVVDRTDQTVDVDNMEHTSSNLRIWQSLEKPIMPVYVMGYESWEQRIDHHDALTDIFSLGMLLGSLVTGYDFFQADKLELFVNEREAIHQIYSDIHPVVLSTLVRMTELHREKRVQDLPGVISVLKNYRDASIEEEVNFSDQEGFITSDDGCKRQMINSHLRDRLFDMSKRNKLIHFRATMQTVNLTVSSVPLMLDYKNIRAESLFTWQDHLAKAIVDEKSIPLDRYLRFEDAPYLTHSLDSLRRDANREKKEYGFSELRFVIAFFRWHNLKEDKDTRINSPMLLHPVELVKKKGVRDTWHLDPIGTVVDVNPALRYYLKQLYNLDLPEAIDLRETSVEEFYSILKQQIQASEPAVEVQLVEKPQIDLVKQRARKRLNTYMKRRRVVGRSVKSYRDIDYSYHKQSFQPLGLQLFLKKVKPSRLPLEYVLSEKPELRAPGITADEEEQNDQGIETNKSTYRLREGSDVNPYVWDFDLCSLTLANFSYKKMSLVRDYNTLLQEDRANPVFDEIFSLAPKQRLGEFEEIPLKDQFLIVPADPTQLSTIAAARSGENLIIQGPPGTGKSQTITNLIADFVAKGKRVLFVCEKRAALDVVFQRLAASGLEDLTCLIHDSQADKKAFIHNLKKTYETFLNQDFDAKSISRKVQRRQRSSVNELEPVVKFGQAMLSQIDQREGRSFTLRDLYGRMVELKDHCPSIEELQLESFPSYQDWLVHGETIQNISEILEELGADPVFAKTAFRHVKKSAYAVDNPVLALKQKVDDIKVRLENVNRKLKSFAFSTETCTLEELRNLSFLADSIRYLAECRLLVMLEGGSSQLKQLEEYERQQRRQDGKLREAQKITDHWKVKLSPRDTKSAITVVGGVEQGVMRFFKPAYWKMRKVMNVSYDFSAHAVNPKWSQVLAELQEEHKIVAESKELTEQLQMELGAEDLGLLSSCIQDFKARRSAAPVDVEDDDKFFSCLMKNDEHAHQTVENLASMHDVLLDLDKALSVFVREADGMEIPEVISVIEGLEKEMSILPELLKDLQDIVTAPDVVYDALCSFEFTTEEYENVCGQRTLKLFYREDRNLAKFEGWVMRRHTEKSHKQYSAWLELNGERVVSRVASDFKELYDRAALPDSQLSAKEKKFKKSYNLGRRELEHEFSKTMRYKSIRDISTGDSGQVVLSLKPIWLMSPLSISDTMPLEDNQFDVVVFDEASQIKLEEAIPAVLRGKQVIVVGDEMQLPPTNFFGVESSEEEESLVFEDDGNEFEYDLSSDSFLTHSGKTLPSRMLGWHYRSRYEALISFSNHTFYGGNLLTIPDRTLNLQKLEEIKVAEVEEFENRSAEVLDRSISFHFMENGVYYSRQNAVEANYIAYLVRDLLNDSDSKTIGVVAFSEAQQVKIEAALSQLAAEDSEFSRKLSVERDREDDGQHVGLFVKNLENVQGDERDIMLLSICYAPDARGKMRMNFGPINRTGGEKRLNVIFSRAKHHMAIVSSIKHAQITNDYNDGAKCLKRFLEYAEAISCGDMKLANSVLSQQGNKKEKVTVEDSIENEMYQSLLEKGYEVERHVGESDFTIELAVRKVGESEHKLAVLLDSAAHYSIEDELERYVLRPGILRAFGWEVIEVMAKDWYHDADQVMQSIERATG